MFDDEDWIDDVEPVCSSDPYYDLFSGGYIDPAKFLEGASLEVVQDAVEVVEWFLAQLDDRGLLEEM